MAASHQAENYHAAYERGGRLSDLERALAGYEEVLKLAQNVDIRSTATNGLGTATWSRYERFGRIEDLDKAVALFRSAVEMYPNERPPMLASFHANLAGVLQLRWLRVGTEDDLIESIEHIRIALAATGPNHSRRAWRLNTLASGLRALALRHGDSSALSEAVQMFRESLAHSRPEDDITGTRSNLAEALRLQHQWSGGHDRSLLDQAVEQARAALAATAGDHPLRPRFQSNLALTLLERFRSYRRPADLTEAESLAEKAVKATPKGNPNRAERTLLLAGIRQTKLMHEPAHPRMVSRALEAARQAEAAVPEGHHLRADALINVGSALVRQAVFGDTKALPEAIETLRRAALDPIAPTRARVTAARQWGMTELVRADGAFTAAAREAFELAVALLPRLTPRLVTHADRVRQLADFSGLARDAAACAIGMGDPEGALRLLEHGRGILLSRALDARSELTALRERHRDLADRFEALRAEFDRPDDSGFSSRETVGALSGEERHAAAREWDRLLGQIRVLPGFADFLQPPAVGDLLAATADHGPVVVVNISGIRCDALLLAGGRVRALPLELVELYELDERVQLFRGALARAESPRLPADVRAEARGVVAGTLRWLWAEVAEPVLDVLNLSVGARLWWVPTGPLTTLPLHAAGPSEGPGVMDRVVSSYAPTVRSLVTAWRSRPGAGLAAPLVIALPTAPGVPPLPNVEAETAMLTERFPGSTVLTGGHAVRQAVLEALPRHPWVHFACHAVSAADGVADGHLVLHDYATAPLTVADIARLRLERADLAYLSACDTGVAHEALNDEALHVAGACHMAGFRHVVGTLWAVKDAIAPVVAETFYMVRGAGGTAAHALHRAVCDLRSEYPDSPTLWAPYVHVGP